MRFSIKDSDNDYYIWLDIFSSSATLNLSVLSITEFLSFLQNFDLSYVRLD